MKVHVEPTSRIIDVRLASGPQARARVWQGETDGGVPVVLLVLRVASDRKQDQAELEGSLVPAAPGQDANEAFPARLIL